MLLEIRGNAETFDSIVTALPEILGCACSKLIHLLIQQRQFIQHLKIDAVFDSTEIQKLNLTARQSWLLQLRSSIAQGSHGSCKRDRHLSV